MSGLKIYNIWSKKSHKFGQICDQTNALDRHQVLADEDLRKDFF